MTRWLSRCVGLIGSTAMAMPAARAAPETPVAVIETVRGLRTDIERLRELRFERDVPISLEDGEQVRAHALHELDRPSAQQDLAAFSAMLSVFRMAPTDTDVRKTYADILAEAVAGYYDPDTRRLVLVQQAGAFEGSEAALGMLEQVTAAHELVHALQDQHFDLWTLRDRVGTDDDIDLALTALIEGDATWSMMLHASPEIARLPKSVDLGTLLAAMGGGESASSGGGALARAPAIFRESLVFPYVGGLVFARALWLSGGFPSLDGAFREPPMSTEQILHPERWRIDPPLRLQLPDLRAAFGEGWTPVSENTVGEAVTRWLLDDLERTPGSAARAAAGWGGDRYSLWRAADGGLGGVWVTTWDSDQDADEFLSQVLPWAEARSGRKIPAKRAVWSTPSGWWAVEARGQDVVVVVDAPELVARSAPSWIGLPRKALRGLDDLGPIRAEPRAVP